MRRNMDVTARAKTWMPHLKTWIPAVAAACVAAGCADGLRWGSMTPKSPPAQPPPSEASESRQADAPADPATPPAADADSLAQVESFLQSLRRYADAGDSQDALAAAEPALNRIADAAPGAAAQPLASSPDPTAAPAGAPPTDDLSSVSNAAIRVPPDSPRESAPAVESAPAAAIPVVEFFTIDAGDAGATLSPGQSSEGPAPGGANAALDIRSPKTTLSVDAYLQELRTSGAGLDPFEAWWREKLMLAALGRSAAVEPATDAAAPATAAPDSAAAELLNGILAIVHEAHRVLRDPLADAGAALTAVEALHRQIADRADLQIPTVAFCREVRSFGNYDTLPDDAFLVGRAVHAIVYLEVENLQCQPADGGGFRTELTTRLELLERDAGRSFWESEQGGIIDVCRRPRSDFFIAQRASFPPTIPAGAYILKVTVEDVLGRKTNQVNVPLTFHTPTSLASGG